MILSFVDDLVDYINDIGLPGDFGLIFVALMLIVGVFVAFMILKVPNMVAILVAVAMIMMFVMFGWFPVWLVVLIAIIIFVLLFLSIKGGSADA